MKPSHLILMTLILLSACSAPTIPYQSYDDYPVYPVQQLGVQYSPGGSTFTLWAPTATYAELMIWGQGTGGDPLNVIQLSQKGQTGIWSVHAGGNMAGMFYTFRVQVDSVWYNQTPGIWTQAVSINGVRGAIVDLTQTNPEGWENDRSPALSSFADIVLYELHHRDMTVSPTSGIKEKGKFVAWTETGTKSPQGESTGIDHLKELGVTHVHLLPSFDFGSINEETLYLNKYNWGYDPVHYNAPEGSYSVNPSDPALRIREFKEMVKSFHDAGIRVVMDVVYNHTYRLEDSPFTNTVPGYFYRTWPDSTYSDASGCGNETASERVMMRRLIIESCKYWVKEYHVDGFRFDLMGVHDMETMNRVREELNKMDTTLFIYGEGWTAGNSPYPIEKRAMKKYAYKMPGIAVYNDDLRDGVKGEVSNDAKTGFVSGRHGMEETVKFGIVGAIKHPDIAYDKVLYSDSAYAAQPTQSISYVSCHDDLCLTDKLRASVPDATEKQLIEMDKLAQTIVLTSQGVPFIFCGEEVFRNKKMVHNSYESPDSINQIDWNFKSVYNDLYLYYKEMIALRKAHPAFRLGNAELVRENLRFLSVSQPGVVAYRLNGKAAKDSWKEIIVIFNGNKNAVNVPLSPGQWRIAVEKGKVLSGKKSEAFVFGNIAEVAPRSATILYLR